jgi:UDP-N-acetylglucosamine 4-epimerase
VLREIKGASVEPTYGPSRKGDILHSLADIRAAREVLGYEPQVLLEEGLQRTVAWYKENRERFYAGKR